MWDAEDDARNDRNIEIITQYETAYNAAIAEADEKGIDVTPENEEWIKLWNSYSEGLPAIEVSLE